MKVCILTLTVLTLAIKTSATETNSIAPFRIGAGEASNYYEREMIVTGKVAQVSIRPKIVLLNLDKPWPNSPFTLVIFPDATNQFGKLNSLNGKSVEVRGKIKDYHNKPEIVLDHSNQLRVVAR